jgi:hypothetical protein
MACILNLHVADLEEVWTALGISGCPQCLCKDDMFGDFGFTAPQRNMVESLELIRTCRRLLLDRGNVTTVTNLLRSQRLSTLHTKIWNPFLLLPHSSFDCFPQDYLHGMYVLCDCLLLVLQLCKPNNRIPQ